MAYLLITGTKLGGESVAAVLCCAWQFVEYEKCETITRETYGANRHVALGPPVLLQMKIKKLDTRP